jgi:hypothetical protein
MPLLIVLILAFVILASGGPANALVDDATPGPAASPVDQDVLPYLAILAFPPDVEPDVTALGTFGEVIALQPGATVVLALGVYDYERCGVGIQCFLPVRIPATWTVSPDDGVRIDPGSGRLTIDPDMPSGSEFTVTAEVDDGRHAVTAGVYVYTPEGNPLVGFWREQAQLSCDGGAEVAPALPIEELIFAADGQFAVTWRPFESYVDYWGTYEFDLLKGTLELTVTGGNHVPDDIDGQGRFAVDDAGNLVLTDIWFGDPDGTEGSPNCGHRFS